jgi:hypothetical protein
LRPSAPALTIAVWSLPQTFAPTAAIVSAPCFAAAFPIAALTVIPAMAVAAPIIDIIARTGIIEIIIPAAIIARRVAARTPIIVVIAAAIIAAAYTHTTIIAVVIGTAAQGDCTGKAYRSQKSFSGPRHCLSPHIICC